MSENKKVATKRMGNFDMASAADRILAFWEKYSNGKITTIRSVDGDGLKVFTTYIWKDKKDFLDIAKIPGVAIDVALETADASSPAKQAEGKEAKKDFEKLDTISTGRALAKLGFLKDGQVASTEELEKYREFNDWQESKLLEDIETADNELTEAKTLDELKDLWVKFPPEVRAKLETKKDEIKDKLTKKAEKKADK